MTMRVRRNVLVLMFLIMLGALVIFLTKGGQFPSTSLSLYSNKHSNRSLLGQIIQTVTHKLPPSRDFTDDKRSRSNMSMTQRSNISREKSTIEKLKFFEPTVTREEKDIFRNLVKVFSETIPRNVTYMMYSGTLLGSFRHNGMIPWDDDLDLMLKRSDKAVVKKSLEKLKPHYQLCTKYSTTWKFYSQNGTIKSKHWTWPFLDLWFYVEEKASIRNINTSWGKLIYKKNDTFPLITRPFMGLMLPAPRYTERVLLEDFENLTICKSNSFDHKTGKWKEAVQLPCDLLKGKYTLSGNL